MITFIGKVFSSIVFGISAFFGGVTPALQSQHPSTTTDLSSPSSSATSEVDNKNKVFVSQKTVANSTMTPGKQPVNGTMCNGAYWNSCQSGEKFVCPLDGGKAYCTTDAATPNNEPQITTQQETTAASIVGKLVSVSTFFFASYSSVDSFGVKTFHPKHEEFDLTFTITAHGKNIYIPLTAGNSPLDGIDYYTVGLLPSTSSTTLAVECSGSVSIINAGNVSYCLIPAEITGTLKLSGSISGVEVAGNAFGISSINFKINPSDTTTYGYTSYTPPDVWVTEVSKPS